MGIHETWRTTRNRKIYLGDHLPGRLSNALLRRGFETIMVGGVRCFPVDRYLRPGEALH